MGYYISIAIITYLGLCFLLFHLGKKKKIGGLWLALTGLIATPVIGFVVYFFSGNRMIVLESRYVCPNCKFEFTHEAEFCPICRKSGIEVRLIPEKRNMV
jgi:hypothetical protein